MITRKGNTLFLQRVKHARSFWEKSLGLIGVHEVDFDYVLLFHLQKETRRGASLHMLFMRMPIDVLFLDAQKKIVDIATLRPWILNYTPSAPAKWVVELPAGTIREFIIRVGDGVEWN
ncbi:MAG: DUF192 domain-containing protein [Candidatus Diapherotrites archaeon]|nr:DUF192 domain-containing protein [Candidatus Diapherotrites archaeon]MDZ4256162.1 DUF192 domain-containing protein [archaeon]